MVDAPLFYKGFSLTVSGVLDFGIVFSYQDSRGSKLVASIASRMRVSATGSVIEARLSEADDGSTQPYLPPTTSRR